MSARSLFRAAIVPAALLTFAFGARAQAQVLDQVPDKAVAVLKVKSLEGLSAKVAKLAQRFGLDQMAPEMKDPLGAVLEKSKLSAGVKKSGDMAIVVFSPEDVEGKPDKAVLVLVPTDDYKAFVGNFKNPEGGAITKAQAPDGSDEVFISHWGDYAAVSPTKSLLSQKPAGLKLSALAAKEAAARDVILYANMDSIRKTALPKLKAERKNILDAMSKNLGDDPKAKKFAPVIKAIFNQYLNGAEEFLTDANTSLVSINLEDDGIATAGIAEFKPESDLGKYALELNSKEAKPLLAGLPDRKYFGFLGMSANPKVVSDIVNKVLDPIVKELNDAGDEGKKFADALESARTMAGSIKSTVVGYPVPTGALGQESVIQTIAVTKGDAKAIAAGERKLIEGVGTLLKDAPQAQGAPGFDFKFTPNAKTIAGVPFDSYSMNMKVDPNDPRAAQMQQVMGMLYGANGMGGQWGVVDDSTFIAASGANDKLLTELIASSKNPQDNLSTLPGVKSVAAHLPKDRILEGYLALDNVVNSAAKYASGLGLPVKIKLPANLPPIGGSVATQGSAVRVDSFVPSSLIESLIAAGIEAYGNFQGGAGGAGGPGSL